MFKKGTLIESKSIEIKKIKETKKKNGVRVGNAGRDKGVVIKKKTPPDQCSIVNVRPPQYISPPS